MKVSFKIDYIEADLTTWQATFTGTIKELSQLILSSNDNFIECDNKRFVPIDNILKIEKESLR